MLNNKHELIYWWIPIEKRGEKPEKQPENRYSWNPKVHMKEWEILSVLNFVKDPEFMERCSEHYPEMTTKEIKEILIDQQEDYTIYDIIHKHEWVSEDVINKYVCRSKYFPEDLSEYIGNEPIKITVDTPEIHDCNLIKLTPELQKKAYWWHRWFRRTISHLLNREDFVWEDWKPLENKTSKLTVVAKVDKGNRWYDEPYILIITAFWWDGKAKKEIDPSKDYDVDLNIKKYWEDHALIVENYESIEIIDETYWSRIREKAKNFTVNETYHKIDGSKTIEIKWWNKSYRIFCPNLEKHTDNEYKSSWNSVPLWCVKWNDLKMRENQALKEYIKERQWEWFYIPTWEEVESLLQELWKEVDLMNIRDQKSLFIVLTSMISKYRLIKWKNDNLNLDDRIIFDCSNTRGDFYCTFDDEEYISLFMLYRENKKI